MSTLRKRIYVGNVVHDAESCFQELYVRFIKFGDCLTQGFEKHGTFAYINMNFDNESCYHKLRNSFNNVKFKGNELKVNLAKDDWKVVWEMRNKLDAKENVRKQQAIKKKDWEYFKKIENIKMNWRDQREIIPGRVRKTPRSKAQLRNVTFRINVNGSLKIYKCYKTKLWGYERSKDLKDLVSKFTNHQWRNGYDHVVDRLNYRWTNQEKNAISVSTEKHSDEDLENMSEEEKEKVNDVLSRLLKDFDFNKPLEFDEIEENEEYDSSGHELNEEHQENERKPAIEEVIETAHAEQIVRPEIEADEPVEVENEIVQRAEPTNEIEEAEEEFIPTFGTGSEVDAFHKEKGDHVGNTDTLRSLFNPVHSSDQAEFKLIAESDEDIDHERDLQLEKPFTHKEASQYSVPVSHGKKKDKFYLFFPHSNSPFLVGQTQISHVKTARTTDCLDNWEEEFWEHRGAWSKEMKRKRRDALRQLNKKWAKNGTGFLL